MQEIWKDIPGYIGLYQASNLGNIRSYHRSKQGKILSQRLRKDGYCDCKLTMNGKSTRFLVHRLVAQAFIPNSKNLLEINHKDFNRSNNKPENLEWSSRKENQEHFAKSKYAEQHNAKLRHENNPRAKLTWDDVNLIRKLRIEYKFKIKRLMWLFGIGETQVHRILRGEQWSKKIKEAI